MAARDTRAALLDAAAAVLRRSGARGLTLNAVAADAGVSKGGLLYHFPSKAALLDALVDGWNEAFEASADEQAGAGPGGWTRGYLQASLGGGSFSPETEAGLLAALAEESARLDTVRTRFQAWQQRLADDGVDPAVAALVRAAADGLWLADLLDLAPPSPDLRAQVVELLERLLDDATG
jgi:AcrR family transcriptional regulator